MVMWGRRCRRSRPRRAIGFTHGLGVPAETGRVWEAGKPTDAVDSKHWQQARSNLDEALSKGMTLVASLAPGAAMRSHEAYLRVNREGKPVSTENVCGLFPELIALCENVGASVARSFGDHPAFGAALIHTEVRDHASLCFHPHDLAAYRAASGAEIPAEATSTRGVDYTKLPDFPADRVIATTIRSSFTIAGIGRMATAGMGQLGRGARIEGRSRPISGRGTTRRFAWQASGSGGQVRLPLPVDVFLPGSIRIGLATDGCCGNGGGGPKGQQVMKMTQIIWYRSQTALSKARRPAGGVSGRLGTPAAGRPLHHDRARCTSGRRFGRRSPARSRGSCTGWQSLVPCQSPGGYRFTHPERIHWLARLVRSVDLCRSGRRC